MTGKLRSSPTDSLSGEASNLLFLTRASQRRSRAGRYAGAAVRVRKNAKAPNSSATLQTCCANHRSGGRWSQEETTVVPLLAQAKCLNHPSRAQSFLHQCFEPPVVSPNHACSYDCLRFTSEGWWQPRPIPRLRSSGLDLALFPCASGGI